MAAANIALTLDVAQIETANTGAFTATKPANAAGKLINSGTNIICISYTGIAVSNSTQAIGQFQIPVGGIVNVKKVATSFSFISLTGASVLSWVPEE